MLQCVAVCCNVDVEVMAHPHILAVIAQCTTPTRTPTHSHRLTNTYSHLRQSQRKNKLVCAGSGEQGKGGGEGYLERSRRINESGFSISVFASSAGGTLVRRESECGLRYISQIESRTEMYSSN